MVQITKIQSNNDSLDLNFYRKYYADMAEKTDDEIYQHWFKVGLAEGRFPNEEEALHKCLSQPGMPTDFDVDGYLKHNQDVAETCTWRFEAADHYLRYGIAENRHYTESPAKTEPVDTPSPESQHGPLGTDKFDAEFYRIVYPDMEHQDDEKCLEHWLRFGRKENRFASFEDFFLQHKNKNSIPAGFSVASYVAKNPDLSKTFTHPIQFLIHFLNIGLDEQRACLPTEYSPRLIKEFYNIKVEDGQPLEDVLSHIQTELTLDIKTPVYLSALELAMNHGIFHKGFIEIFDHEAYRYSNEIARDLPVKNYAKCLEHFLTQGLQHSAQISYRHHFDPKFYLSEYKESLPRHLAQYTIQDLQSDGDENNETVNILFKHWIYEGISHEMYPNLIVWAKHTHNYNLPVRLVNDLNQYELLNPDLAIKKKPSEFFAHMVRHGIVENRPGIIYNSETASFFSEVAQVLMETGKRTEAVKIYNKILQNSPDFPIASHNLADDLLRHGFHADAANHYEQLVKNQTATQWSYINLSVCYDQMSNDFQSAKSLQLGANAFPDDINLDIRSKKAAKHHFNEILRHARADASFQGIDYSRARVRKALNLYEGPNFAPLKNTQIHHVTVVGNHDLPQCRSYRIDQKIEHLKKAGYQVRVFKHSEDLTGYHERLEETDAIFFYRVAAIPEIIEAIIAANVRGIPTFYEIDDLLFDENLFPPPFETYADQISYKQYSAMATDVPLLSHAMGLCRFGLASTRTLAEAMKPHISTGEVFLHKNAFGSLHETMSALPPVNKEATTDQQSITIFYGSGTKAHKEDFHQLVEPVFVKLHQKYGTKVQFLILGHISMTPELESLGDQLELMDPIWDTEDYWNLLRETADINLAVLSKSLVTDAKSEIKWLEAAMFGIPSVVSKTTTYEDVISHGETGFLCDNQDDFYHAIDKLIEDKDLRIRIGEAARETVLENYSIKAQAENIKSILKNSVKTNNQNRKKRIAIVNVFYPPQAVGGATRVVYDNVTDFLTEFGDQAEVAVFTSINGETPYELKQYVHDGVPVTAVTTENTEFLEQRISDPQMGIAFARFLENFKPDLVHFHCVQRLTSTIISETRKAEIPYIITAHDGWWISDQQFLVDNNDEISTYQYNQDAPQKSNISNRQRVLRKELFGAEYIAAVSDPFAKIYKDAGLPNVITIENGVSKLEVKPKIPSETGRIRLAHIGGNARHKGFHLVRHALMASPEFNNLELLVVDHAAQKGSVRYDRWGSTPVTFIPKVPQNEITDLFSQIDILLAPSIWPESYGLVTREALMCGCRVIASNIGGIGQCVDHGVNGLLVDISDADSLRDALAEVNANPEFYAEPLSNIPNLRPAIQQSRELAKLYREVLTK